MLDTQLTDEQTQLKKTVAAFAREVVAPVAAHHDETKTFPYDVVRQMGEMGLFGLPFPEEYGGMGGDYFALCLVLEELGKVDQSALVPLISHWPSCSTAVVRVPPASLPAPASVSPKAPNASPAHSRGSHCSFWASVPKR